MDHYPVVIETRTTHVVWLPAEDPDDAVAQIEESNGADLDQLLDITTVVDGDYSVRAPDELDWGTIRGHEREPDSHVRTHTAHLRELAQAECAAAGHHPTNHHRYRNVIECDLCSVVVGPADVEAVPA